MLCIDDKYIIIQLFEDKHIGTNMNSTIQQKSQHPTASYRNKHRVLSTLPKSLPGT